MSCSLANFVSAENQCKEPVIQHCTNVLCRLIFIIFTNSLPFWCATTCNSKCIRHNRCVKEDSSSNPCWLYKGYNRSIRRLLTQRQQKYHRKSNSLMNTEITGQPNRINNSNSTITEMHGIKRSAAITFIFRNSAFLSVSVVVLITSGSALELLVALLSIKGGFRCSSTAEQDCHCQPIVIVIVNTGVRTLSSWDMVAPWLSQ